MNLILKLKAIKQLIILLKYKIFNKIIVGYEDLSLNKSILNKTLKFKNISEKYKNNINYQRTKFFCDFIKNKRLQHIYDFGGGAGYHFFIIRKYIKHKLYWNIIENKQLVELAKKKIREKNLKFHKEIKWDKIRMDVFFASSSLCYVKDMVKLLYKISNLKSKYLYLSRTPLTNDKSLSCIQYSRLSDNGPCKIKNDLVALVKYRINILNIKIFEKILKKNFYIEEKYIDEKNSFRINDQYYHTYTYIFKKKN